MSSAAHARDSRVDGRLARSERTRTAVVDALLALIEEGDLQPPAPRIAERAGVSLRSVFQHFADLEALFAAAADRQTQRIKGLARRVPRSGSLPVRLHAFVAQRVRLLETISPVRRAALLMEPFSAEVAGRLRQARALGYAEVEQVFAAELTAHATPQRRELIAALSVTSSWPTWEALRQHGGLSVEQARKVMTRTLAALLNESKADGGNHGE